MKSPAFRITISGSLLTTVSSIQVIDSADKEDMLDLKVPAVPNPYSTGSPIEVFLGYGTNLTWVGLFHLDDVGFEESKQGSFLCLRARSVPHALGNENVPVTQTWEVGSIGALVSAIAGRNGLRPQIGSIGSQQLKLLHQRAESDLAFLDRLAKLYGSVSKIKGNAWVFKRLGEDLGSGFPTIVKPRSALLQYSGTPIMERFKFKGVRTFWYDTQKAEMMPVEVGEPPYCEIKQTCRDESDAAEQALGRLTSFSRGSGQFKAMLPGDPNLAAECLFAVTGAAPGFDHTWRLTQVTHRIEKMSGFITSIEGELPGESHATEEPDEDEP